MTEPPNATDGARPAAPGGLIVSPYLHELNGLDDRPHRGWLLHHPSADGAVRAGLAVKRLHAISDVWKKRILVVTRSEYQLLRDIDVGSSIALTDDAESVAWFVSHHVLMSEQRAYSIHEYTSVEIELNRHCNMRCQFCPVATAPKPKAFMTPETFALVLDRVVEYGAPQVSLNHYSEPSLCRDLADKIEAIAARGLTARLHTNASLLDDETIARIAAAGNLSAIWVNLPSSSAAEFKRITGTNLFERAVGNVERMATAGLPVRLSINAPRDSRDEVVARINDRFADLLGESVSWCTTSRAGFMDDERYVTPVRRSGRLSGCIIALQQINVSWEGRVFLCCQDFDQEFVLGDLREHSLREIADSERAVTWRSWILGGAAPPSSFLCTTCEWTEARDTSRGFYFGAAIQPREDDAALPITLSDAAVESCRAMASGSS